jgi:hypothetical protein
MTERLRPRPPKARPTLEIIDANAAATNNNNESSNKSRNNNNGNTNGILSAARITSLLAVDTTTKSIIELDIPSLVVGAVSGAMAVAPAAYFHCSMAQFPPTVAYAAVQAALFANTYRYLENSAFLRQCLVIVFIVARTYGQSGGNLALDYYEYALESAILFGAASLAMDYRFYVVWISKYEL